MKFVLVSLIFVVCSGCASSGDGQGWFMPDSPNGPHVSPAAYAADEMIIRKEMPHTDNPPKFEFYYEHCAMNGNEAYYSKTSYDCSGPY